jgi:hypothetical protein
MQVSVVQTLLSLQSTEVHDPAPYASTSIALSAGFSTRWTKSNLQTVAVGNGDDGRAHDCLALPPAATTWSKFEYTVVPSTRMSNTRLPVWSSRCTRSRRRD